MVLPYRLVIRYSQRYGSKCVFNLFFINLKADTVTFLSINTINHHDHGKCLVTLQKHHPPFLGLVGLIKKALIITPHNNRLFNYNI